MYITKQNYSEAYKNNNMLSNLAKCFGVPNELKEKEKFDILSKKIIEQIENENNFFKIVSLIGINNIFKIIKFCPGLQFYLNEIYIFFENFYCDIKNEKSELNDMFKKLENKFKFSELINSLTKQKNEQKLLYLFGLVNLDNKMVFLFIILCLLRRKIMIIFEYDKSLSSSYIGLYNILKLFNENVYKKVFSKIELNKILHIKFNNDNFTFSLYENNNNINLDELKEFEIITCFVKFGRWKLP
jgi:hypothetical protein